MVRLWAVVKKLCAMEQVRQQGDKERHLLRLDKDKECDRLTKQIDPLQSVNQRLREIASKQNIWLKMAGSCYVMHLLTSLMIPYLLADSQWNGGGGGGGGGEGSVHSPPPVLSAEVEELMKVLAKKKGAEQLQLAETASVDVITVNTLGGKGSWSQVCRWQDQITWW